MDMGGRVTQEQLPRPLKFFKVFNRDKTMSNRFNLYRDAHKAIRMFLSEFSLMAGRSDYSDKADLASLKKCFDQVYDMFMVHTKVEDSHIMPLLKQFDEALYEQLENDHHEVDKLLEDLKAQLYAINANDGDAAAKGYDFYLQINRFIAFNLKHIDDEESLAMPVLWENMNDEELMACFGKIRADIPPPLMNGYYQYMFPSMRVFDISMMLKGIKAAAPPEIFEKILVVANSSISESDNEKLKGLLPK